MRSPLLPLVAVALMLPLAACATSRPRRAWTPPVYSQPQPAQPSYAMPWAVPVPAATGPASAAAPAAGDGWAEKRSRCLAEGGTADDCTVALAAAAAAWDPTPGAAHDHTGVHDAYRAACERKAKLHGCAVFKSRAVTADDRAQVELLMLCEAGRPEACEDVTAKANALHAWLGTLKADWCKKGHTALCKSPRECRGNTQWGCRAATQPPGAGEVCGCVPRTCESGLTVTAAVRKWPDGTTRGTFTCGATR